MPHNVKYIKKEIVEKGNNYFHNPIHFMEKFFETRIENLEKSIPPRNKKRNKKTPKERNNSDD